MILYQHDNVAPPLSHEATCSMHAATTEINMHAATTEINIQEPIYNYLEDNILQIFPRFMDNITPSFQKHLYVMSSVPTHTLMTAFKRTLKP